MSDFSLLLEVFRSLRLHAFSVSEESFMHSMCEGALSGGQQGEGKSGMLFFSSREPS